jgi:hypothetical protein
MATINSEIIEKLSTTKQWTPLAEMLSCIEQNKFFDAHYYSINDSIYIQASSFYKNDFLNTSNAPFASAILYVGGKGSASRIIHRNIEADDGLSITPYPSIWPENYQLTYKGSIDFFKSEGLASMETASYRIATDGKFIFKSIENRRYKLFFRSSHIEDCEAPFGLLYKLRES